MFVCVLLTVTWSFSTRIIMYPYRHSTGVVVGACLIVGQAAKASSTLATTDSNPGRQPSGTRALSSAGLLESGRRGAIGTVVALGHDVSPYSERWVVLMGGVSAWLRLHRPGE